MQVQALARLDGFRMGSVGSVLVTVFHQTATLERLALLEQVETQFVKSHPAMYALNIVLGESVTAPPAEVRERAAALQKRFESANVAAATVLGVKGIAAAIARGFMATLALVSSSKPTQVFKTVHDAVVWFQGLPGAPAELQGLDVAALEAFAAEVMPRR